MEKLEEFLEFGGTQKDIAFLAVLMISIFDLLPLPFYAAWVNYSVRNPNYSGSADWACYCFWHQGGRAGFACADCFGNYWERFCRRRGGFYHAARRTAGRSDRGGRTAFGTSFGQSDCALPQTEDLRAVSAGGRISDNPRTGCFSSCTG